MAVHATLVSIDAEGQLMLGRSGAGKTTRALALVAAGGRLVADDVVVIERVGDSFYGAAPKRFAGLFADAEGRIFDIRAIYGERSYAPRCKITRCTWLGPPDPAKQGEFTEVLASLSPATCGSVFGLAP